MIKSLKVALFLGTRSIIRGNIGVTLLIIAMLMLANLNLNFVSGLMDGIVHSANAKLINTYSSDMIVESGSDSPYVTNAQELVGQIASIKGVDAVTYRSNLGAELDANDRRVNCVIRSIVPTQDSRVFDITGSIIEGSYLNENDTDSILLGIQLAGANRTNLELYSSSLKTVHAGDKIKVTYANGVTKQYTVKGIFYTEFIQTDLQAFVTEREFLSINPLANDAATGIYIKTNSTGDFAPVIDAVSRLRENLQILTWEDTAGIVSSMTNSFAIIRSIMAVINMLVAGITVFIVTYIDLTQKRRQIGIERAIGITPGAISMSYLFRAVFYAIVAILASLLVYKYAVIPLEAGHPFHFPFGDVLLFTNISQLVRSALIILGVSVIAALLPVWQTLRLRILDAIWG